MIENIQASKAMEGFPEFLLDYRPKRKKEPDQDFKRLLDTEMSKLRKEGERDRDTTEWRS